MPIRWPEASERFRQMSERAASEPDPFTVGPDGSVRIAWQPGVVVYVRQDGPRLKVARLLVEDPTPTGLRQIRLGAIEAAINLFDVKARLVDAHDEETG